MCSVHRHGMVCVPVQAGDWPIWLGRRLRMVPGKTLGSSHHGSNKNGHLKSVPSLSGLFLAIAPGPTSLQTACCTCPMDSTSVCKSLMTSTRAGGCPLMRRLNKRPWPAWTTQMPSICRPTNAWGTGWGRRRVRRWRTGCALTCSGCRRGPTSVDN